MMDSQRCQEDILARIHGLVTEYEAGTRVVHLRNLAREELKRGYSREALLKDFERVRSWLEAHDRDDEEDDIVTVMDALVGWCSPGFKL